MYSNLITPIKVIGTGGSAYIIESIVNYDDLVRGQHVVLKHCIGYLTKMACDLFINEANILKDLKENLIKKNICNNFPVYYSYFTGCLFGSVNTLRDILSHGDNISDALFYYSNKPELGFDLYQLLRNKYSADYLINIRDKLKIQNFDVIESLYPLNSSTYESSDIIDFLSDELDVECSPNIVMSKINGYDLNSLSNFKFTDGLLFEIIYTNACLIKFNGKIFRDNNLSNIMIETYPYPKIYKVKDLYYMFSDGYRLLIIDVKGFMNCPSCKELQVDGLPDFRCNH
jgi:hypothetical protein